MSCIPLALLNNRLDKWHWFIDWHLIFREVYNIVDDDPAPREEVFEYARKLVEKKWPGLNLQIPEQKDWSIVRTRNLRGEKRVSNARMKKELGVQLLYPDYRSGLQSIIDQIESPFHSDWSYFDQPHFHVPIIMIYITSCLHEIAGKRHCNTLKCLTWN